MRFNPFKNIRLSFQLYSLVAVSLLIAAGLIAYAMNLVQATQGTLKHTIDNRMVSGQSIQGVADALNLALEDSLKVIEKTQTPQEAHEEIKAAMDKAHEDWDNYFLGDMIPDEQALADETTPLLGEGTFSADIQVLNFQPIVVEKALYWNSGDEIWAAGTGTVGIPIPPPE